MPEGATLLGDKGYDSSAICEAATATNTLANIPSRSNRKQRFALSGWLYRQRNLIERFFNVSSTSEASPMAMTHRELPRSWQAHLCTHLMHSVMSLRPNFAGSSVPLNRASIYW